MCYYLVLKEVATMFGIFNNLSRVSKDAKKTIASATVKQNELNKQFDNIKRENDEFNKAFDVKFNKQFNS